MSLARCARAVRDARRVDDADDDARGRYLDRCRTLTRDVRRGRARGGATRANEREDGSYDDGDDIAGPGPGSMDAQPRVRWKNRAEIQVFLNELSASFPDELDEMRQKVRDDVRRASQCAVQLIAAQACFVGAMCLSSQSLNYFSAPQFTLARGAMSLPFIYLLARTSGDTMRELRNVKKRNALFTSWVVILLGACVCLAQICLAYGLKSVSLGNAVVLGQLVPVYSCTIAVFQGIEKPSVGKFAAIGVSVLGAILLLDPARMWLSQGNILLLLRSAIFAAYLAFQQPILREYNPITVAVVSQTIGALMSMAIAIPHVLSDHLTAHASISLVTAGGAWVAVAGVGVLASAAYTLTTRAETFTTPVVTACYGSLQPIFAGVIMSAGLGGAVLARDAIAASLILAGSIFAAAKSTLERSEMRVLERTAKGAWNTLSGDPTIAIPRVQEGVSYPAPIDMTLDLEDSTFDVSRTVDDADNETPEQGTVIIKGGKGSARTRGTPSGTVRLKRKSRRTQLARSTALWTIAWAFVLSIASLAGAGFIGWSIIYLYWRFLC